MFSGCLNNQLLQLGNTAVMILVSLSKDALSRGGDKKTIDLFIHN